MNYLIYRIGYFIAMHMPKGLLYAVAAALGDIYLFFSSRDRDAVVSNMRIILGEAAPEEEVTRVTRNVFRNFAKYLVDFFRFEKIDSEYIKSNINIVGLENLDRAIAEKKGVIALSAHIGNWELGGIVTSKLRGPIGAIVLTHANKKIDAFFTRQRSLGDVKAIKIGAALRACFQTLKTGKILAVLGDRDFSGNGVMIEFFGKTIPIPRGPAVLSQRLGSCIVPCFMIRKPDDKFDFIFEEPIYPDSSRDEEPSVKAIAERYARIIESYVRRYPDQWFMFRKVWNDKDEDMRPDSII